MPVSVVTDSVSYLPPAMIGGLPLEMVSLYVVDEGVSVPETEVADRDFYDRLAAQPVLPTSAQPALTELAGAFERAIAICGRPGPF